MQSTKESWNDESERMVPFGSKCPHGNDWFNCKECERESDWKELVVEDHGEPLE